MRGVSVQVKDEEATGTPDQAARKRVAVELIRDHDRPLRWTARRYSICADDAEDAYQRGIEILLSKAPTDDVRQLLPWTRTVIKHEALAIRKTRERTLGRPSHAGEEDQPTEDWIELIPAGEDGPDEMTVRRERIARSREALTKLKPAELKALTQLAEGFSYREIGAMNDWSQTKVNRCLAEGRARFRSAFRESEAGERCPTFEPLLSACCDGELSRGQLADLENHLAVCGHCRATLRAFRAAPKAAAALAPVLPLGHGLWERAQELLVSAHLRFQGIGRSPESALQSVAASGGTRGAGIAAMAKLAALCAGTAGTAAVCAATGIVPTAGLLPHEEKPPAIERQDARPAPQPITPVTATDPKPNQETQSGSPVAEQPEAKETEPAEQPSTTPTQAPPPTPTETEFTPEAAGTPVPTPASPPAPKPKSNPIPVGNGGGEFAP